MALFTVLHEHHVYFHSDANTAAGHAAILAAITNLKETIMSIQDDVNTLTQQLADATATISANTQTIAGQGTVIAKVGEEIKALQAAVGSAVDLESAKAAVAAMVTAVADQAAAVQAQGVSLTGLDDLNPDATA